MRLTRKHLFTLTLSLLLGFVIVLPHTAGALGTAADAMCTPVIQACPCGTVPGPKGGCVGGKNMFMCPCWDITSDYKTNGKCIAANTCRAESTGGKDGFGLDQVSKILGDLMGKLMQQGGGQQDGAQPPSAPTTGAGNSGCVQTYQVTTPSTDPCAIYIPAVSDSLLNATTTGSGSIFDLIDANTNTNTNTNASGTSTSVIDQLTNGGQNNTNTNVSASTTQATTTVPVFTNPAYLLPGLRGDIQVINAGGTVVAGSRDVSGNTEVAGFYGGSTFSGQGQGVVASLCRARPWSNNFLSFVLPANFFDSLCVARGYQVGTPAPQNSGKSTVTVSQSKPQTIEKPATTTQVSTVPAKVRVWSVPAAVPLGSRASIYWTSQGVVSCLVTSPDGSFSQTTLAGGASTVALTGATTFTISCLTPDGTPVTDFVTVNIAI